MYFQQVVSGARPLPAAPPGAADAPQHAHGAAGISYCHHQGVYHRDLKLENLLMASEGSDQIKIMVRQPSAAPRRPSA